MSADPADLRDYHQCGCGNWLCCGLCRDQDGNVQCGSCGAVLAPEQPTPVASPKSVIIGRKTFLSNSLRSRLEKANPAALPAPGVLTADPREASDEQQHSR